MSLFGGDSPSDPMAYDPAVDGIYPDQPSGEQDPAVATSDEQAQEWALTHEADRETYEPPSYTEDSES